MHWHRPLSIFAVQGRAQDDSGLGRRSQGSAPIKAIQVPGGAHSEPPSLVPSLSTSPGAPTEDWLDSKERFMAVMQNFLPKVGNIAAPGKFCSLTGRQRPSKAALLSQFPHGPQCLSC